MSKLIAFAAVVAVVLIPAAAGAAPAAKTSGVVVAKDAARHTLVVASPHGKLTTIRTTAAKLRATRVGSRIAAWGSKLPDGSFHATRVQHKGASKHARIRATVLKVHGTKLLLAGGGSVFGLRLARGAHVTAASRKSLSAGEKVDADVELSHGAIVGHDVAAVGTSVLIDFSGKVTALDATTLTVKTDDESTVVAIPDGITLPSIVKVGSEVEIVASLSDSTLTLVALKLDGDAADSGDDGGSSVDGDSGVHVNGFVTALDSSSVTIQPGDSASPVTFAIPDGFELPAGLTAGSKVEARGTVVDSVLTLTKLKLQSDSGDDGSQEIETEGTVTAHEPGSITIKPAGDGAPLTFTTPDGFTMPDGIQLGSMVSAKGELVSSVLTLTEIELKDSGDDDSQEIETKGTVLSHEPGTVTIQPAVGGSPLTFSIPDGFAMPDGISHGAVVSAKGEFVDSVLTLTEIELQDDGDGGSGD